MKKTIFSLVFAGVLLAGCGSTGATGDSSSGSSATGSGDTVQITAVGSTALQPLVEAAGEEFAANNANYQISVQGGGSGTGLSQVESGAVTIGNSDVFAEEKDGVDASKIVDHQVAIVGMGPVINSEVGVTDLSKEDLVKIFTGEITNWNEVGGADQEIVVINRASGSGTRSTFEKWALDGATPIESQEQDSSGTVRQIVSSTPGAISYLAFSYFDDSLTALSIDGVEPVAENVEDNSWTIWSYEHMYTNGEPDADVQAFIDYIMSDDVQNGIVQDLGYLPVNSMQVQRSVDGDITEVN
ncbi:phosphate ABC transporter substrate-binding protein PstS family protein [Enterococcus sp. HY326]|uniref:phosphate ABC transporter substrate-binding protein PstS family protein n=1 Tax=Enterococcus sp. HY326 TaxID=2971265 RepID=UPI002240D483|nr:phosphate ABC transporter substrate-binding protein PstS family protein [Enterococcus sp. HY326]